MNDLAMSALPSGTFAMGSTGYVEDETPQHEVVLCAFECMSYPVTRRLWAEITKFDSARKLV